MSSSIVANSETDKLSTIEETASMELQVSEWENEIIQLKSNLQIIENQQSKEEQVWLEKVEQLEKEKNILEKRQEEMERLIFHGEKNEESVGRKRLSLKSPPSSPNDSS